jgi:hypothetical protein
LGAVGGDLKNCALSSEVIEVGWLCGEVGDGRFEGSGGLEYLDKLARFEVYLEKF